MLAALLDEAARREGLPSAGRGSEVGKFWGLVPALENQSQYRSVRTGLSLRMECRFEI